MSDWRLQTLSILKIFSTFDIAEFWEHETKMRENENSLFENENENETNSNENENENENIKFGLETKLVSRT